MTTPLPLRWPYADPRVANAQDDQLCEQHYDQGYDEVRSPLPFPQPWPLCLWRWPLYRCLERTCMSVATSVQNPDSANGIAPGNDASVYVQVSDSTEGELNDV